MEIALKTRGIELVRTKVGDRYVLEELEKRQWLLGGEARATCWCWTNTPRATAWFRHCRSCRRCSAVARRWRSCCRPFGCFRRRSSTCAWPHAGTGLENQPARGRGHPRRQAELGESGRVLIRASGTEPLVRVMVEARDAALAQSSAERIAHAIAAWGLRPSAQRRVVPTGQALAAFPGQALCPVSRSVKASERASNCKGRVRSVLPSAVSTG